MSPFALMHRTIDALRDLPPVRQLRRRAFDKRFNSHRPGHLFRGVFGSFEEARASAPATLPLGYDNAESASLYLQRLRADEYDYPAMFWLSQSLADGMASVVDLGGSVGIKFFAFGRAMGFPAHLTWRVIEVPAAVELGRTFASERGVSQSLQFSDSVAAADGADVLFASGSLQYLPQTLGDILASLASKPKRVIVNTTPIHPSRSFFTLNGIGTAFCPYRVQSHEEFVGSVTQQGYVLHDQWLNRGKAMALPFDVGYGVDHYSGFCFDARSLNAGRAASLSTPLRGPDHAQ